MDEIIQIKCPFDGAVLSVKNQPGIETKSVTCPVCKHKYPFTRFKRVVSNLRDEDPATEYPDMKEHANCGDELTHYGGGDITEIADLPNYIIGRVVVVGSGVSYQLKPGRNVIGRKGKTSEANFQIDTAGNRSMSREHLVIEVKKMQKKGFVHYLSLYKEKVGKTYIGTEPLLYGDCIVLNHGDIIKLPDATLRFEMPDGEETDI